MRLIVRLNSKQGVLGAASVETYSSGGKIMAYQPSVVNPVSSGYLQDAEVYFSPMDTWFKIPLPAHCIGSWFQPGIIATINHPNGVLLELV